MIQANKLYIGCGPLPVHPQHLEVLGNPSEWTFIDKFVVEPHIKNWDGRTLDEVVDGTVDEIYSSHTLEHFEHESVPQILETWHRKMKPGAKLTINVPNLLWLCRQITRKAGGGIVESSYYTEWMGEHGIMSILYGSQSHEGEYHKSAYTPQLLQQLLQNAGFYDVDTMAVDDAHHMGVIIATAKA